MRIDIISALPNLLHSPLNDSIMLRAQEKNLVELVVHDLRSYARGKQRQIDDYAFGGGAGMVLMAEPLLRCLDRLHSERSYAEVIYLTPDGHTFTQQLANRLSTLGNLLLICGHYKGIDERVRQHCVSMEVSIGDYVLSGGELAAAVVTDAVVRLLPGVLSDGSSALTDSFQDGLLAPPVYTRPAVVRGWEVPPVLTSGNAAAIDAWNYEQALLRTMQRRPDLYEKFSAED